jgi:VCBS repeat-containing protein
MAMVMFTRFRHLTMIMAIIMGIMELQVINNNTNTVSVSQTQAPLQNFTLAAQGNFAYFFNTKNQLIAFNSTTHTCAVFVTNGTSFIKPTCKTANPATGEVYVVDAKDLVSNGTLYAFVKTVNWNTR